MSFQAALQSAEEGFKEKEVIQRDFLELKDMYDHNTQLLLEEVRKNEALTEERQESNRYIQNLRFNVELLETEHFELREKGIREEENMDLVDQLTKQVASLQAALQSAEEGFKKEKEVIQRNFQELKDMYEHNTQRLLEELRKNETLKEKTLKTKEYVKEITNNLEVNLANLELERCNNKELMEKLRRKEDTELVDQLTKQVASLQAALQSAEEGFKKEKEVIQRDFQELKDIYEHNTQRQLEELEEIEVLKEERQKTREYVKEITQNLEFNLQNLELERCNNKELMEKLRRKEDTELVDQLTKQVASLQAALQMAEEGFKEEKEKLEKHLQETHRLFKEQRENVALMKKRQESKTYIKKLFFNMQHLRQSAKLMKELREEWNMEK